MIDDLVSSRHHPAPSRRFELNKAGRSKKVVYQLQPLDELLCRVLNRLLQPRLAAFISPICHSFQPRRSAITAFESLLTHGGVHELASLHVDIADFFNSIDVEDLLATLPPPLLKERAVMRYLELLLRDPHVVGAEGALLAPRKGVMAGTPLAPLLSNLYLRELDGVLSSSNRAVARYSDDILALASRADLESAEDSIRGFLRQRGLRVNEAKTRRGAEGEPWEFLGFKYHRAHVGLSDNTIRRFHGKVRRRARRLARHRAATNCEPERTCRMFISSLNRKLYGVHWRGDADFSWARWFFQLLTTPAQLRELDQYVQTEMRWAAAGHRRPRARSVVPYRMLRDAGYRPLVSAYYEYRRG